MLELTVETEQRSQAVNLTRRINRMLDKMDGKPVGLHLWVPHTTAGITVNESADPAVMEDLIHRLEEVIPWEGNYDHIEDNAAAHIKSMLLGSHQWVPVAEGELNLGRWQGIFFLEWDGPRTRTVQVQVDSG